MSEEEQQQLLVNQNEYLEVGIHIASKSKMQGMKRFIYKTRDDGLYLLDLKTIDSRIRLAANMIARYEPKDIVVTASRIYAVAASEKFAQIIGAGFMKGRVKPGVFTNPDRDDFQEPKLMVISDTRNEKQAVKEASKVNIPIIALCDTDNLVKYVDLILPSNNRGRRSLAFIYYLLARETLKAKGLIKSDEEFKYTVADFEARTDSAPPRPAYAQEEEQGAEAQPAPEAKEEAKPEAKTEAEAEEKAGAESESESAGAKGKKEES